MDIDGTPLEEASIAQIHTAMFRGKVSARQLVDAYLARIEAYDQRGPALNAVVTLNDQARAQADALDALLARGTVVGPLHGVPVVIKDCLETADMPTSYGSEIFANYRPAADATVVAKLRAAGAIILAKTTLPDWATSPAAVRHAILTMCTATPVVQAGVQAVRWLPAMRRLASGPTVADLCVSPPRSATWSVFARRLD